MIKDKNGKLRKPPGSKPTIASVDTDEKRERWRYPTPPESLTDKQKKLIIATILGQMVTVVFYYHYYEFDGDIYHQVAGGPT